MLDEAPFSSLQDNRRQGCDPAFYQQLLAPVAVGYRFYGYPINRLMEVFSRADTDLVIVPGASHNPPSAPAFEFLGPIHELHEVVVTRNRSLTSRLEDFSGMRVGQANSICWGLCQQLRAKHVAVIDRSFRSVEQGVRLLLANRVDAIVAPEHIYRMVRASLPPQGSVPVISYHGPSQYLFLAINRQLPAALRQQIRASSEQMGPSGYHNHCEPLLEEPLLR